MANGRDCGTGSCAHCGKEFKKSSNGAKYCSENCAYEALKAARREARRKKNEVLMAPRACPVCGSVFKPHKVKQKFCCGKCAVKAKRAQLKEGRTVEKSCLQCGTKFRTSRSDRRFCSVACGKRHAALEKYKAEHGGRLPGRPGRKKSVVAKDVQNREAVRRTIVCTALTEEQRRQVLIDLGVPSAERWKRSSKWTPQMHAYARKVWTEKTNWCASCCSYGF